jgi:Flp pilus assembly protein TadG/uncharacterized protein YegL
MPIQDAAFAGAGRKTEMSMFRRFAADRQGAFGLAFALTAIPLLLAIGCSFDYMQALNMHRKMQTDLDAALVAAVRSVGSKDEDALKAEIANWLEAEAEIKGFYALNSDGIEIDTTNATISASVNASVPTSFLKIAGIDTMPIAAASAIAGTTSITTKNPFSMYLVLDRSGSMNEATNTSYTTTCAKGKKKKKKSSKTCTKKYTKMEALQIAVSDLMTQLDAADPEMKYVRTGVVSYSSAIGVAVDLDWGTDHVDSYVTDLTPVGGTNSGAAFKKAYDSLTAASDNSAHLAKNGKTPAKYIVFMTDGDNNDESYDVETKRWCDAARTANITVYTIAFMAPDKGKSLLEYCATTSSDYFEPEGTAALVTAFATIGQSSSSAGNIRLTQ